MELITLIGISVGLAMDAFAVSVASGFILKSMCVRDALRIALFFGGFQAVMPLIGWAAGLSFRQYIEPVDHWIAFGLLTLIGSKMIYEAFQLEPKQSNPRRITVLLLLSLATSIDALAVGLTLAVLKTAILRPVIFIGLITFGMSFSGVYIGNRVGHVLENKIEIIGGTVLIGIGLKILIEHLFL